MDLNTSNVINKQNGSPNSFIISSYLNTSNVINKLIACPNPLLDPFNLNTSSVINKLSSWYSYKTYSNKFKYIKCY